MRPHLGRLGFLCGVRTLLQDAGASIADFVHPWLHNVSRNFVVDLGDDPQALG